MPQIIKCNSCQCC